MDAESVLSALQSGFELHNLQSRYHQLNCYSEQKEIQLEESARHNRQLQDALDLGNENINHLQTGSDVLQNQVRQITEDLKAIYLSIYHIYTS